MAPVACGTCRTVAPLIARYNDPDLNEVERVRLSTHLLQCPHCLARLQDYRAHDQRIRRMSGMTLAPQVREAVLERVAAPRQPGGVQTLSLVWRQTWVGAASALSLTALVLTLGLATFRTAQGGGVAGGATANERFALPLTTTILSANPTQAIGTVGASLGGGYASINARASLAAPVAATVREVRARDNRLVVQIAGARGEETVIVARDTVITRQDGSRATLGDIAVGSTIQLQRDQQATGGPIARQIVLAR